METFTKEHCVNCHMQNTVSLGDSKELVGFFCWNCSAVIMFSDEFLKKYYGRSNQTFSKKESYIGNGYQSWFNKKDKKKDEKKEEKKD